MGYQFYCDNMQKGSTATPYPTIMLRIFPCENLTDTQPRQPVHAICGHVCHMNHASTLMKGGTMEILNGGRSPSGWWIIRNEDEPKQRLHEWVKAFSVGLYADAVIFWTKNTLILHLLALHILLQSAYPIHQQR